MNPNQTNNNGLTSSSTSPAIQNIQFNPKTHQQSPNVPSSNSINMALYQYDYNIKAAKFANQNGYSNNLFNQQIKNDSNASPVHKAGLSTQNQLIQPFQQIQLQQQQQIIQAQNPNLINMGPTPNSRPEKTKSVVRNEFKIIYN